MPVLSKAEVKAVAVYAAERIALFNDKQVKTLNPYGREYQEASSMWIIGYNGGPYPGIDGDDEEENKYMYKAWCVGSLMQRFINMQKGDGPVMQQEMSTKEI